MIDFHAHRPSQRGTWGLKPYGAIEYLGFMEEAGILASVVMTTDGLFLQDPSLNDEVADFASADPAKLYPFATVNPRAQDAAVEVKRCLSDLGMVGLKFHPWLQGFMPHEPIMDPICELAAEHGVPVLFHDGTPPYSTALQIAALARRHPRVQFVLGHAGLHDLWREAIRAVLDHENVHACMCGSPSYAMREIVRYCPPERILFGTDAGLESQAHQQYVLDRIVAFGRLPIDPVTRRMITLDNPQRLLSIRGSS